MNKNTSVIVTKKVATHLRKIVAEKSRQEQRHVSLGEIVSQAILQVYPQIKESIAESTGTEVEPGNNL